MKYRVSLIVQSREEITENAISDRIEYSGFEPFVEVLDIHVEEEHEELEGDIL